MKINLISDSDFQESLFLLYFVLFLALFEERIKQAREKERERESEREISIIQTRLFKLKKLVKYLNKRVM